MKTKTTHNVSVSGILLLFFSLFFLGSTNPLTLTVSNGCDDEITINGNVKREKSNQGVGIAGEIRNAPNNKGAEFYDNNDNVVAQLKHTVPAGRQVVVFWKRRAYTSTFSGPAKLAIYESVNGISYSYNTTLTTTVTTNYIQGTLILAGDTKFLKLVNPSSSASGSPDFLVDAITYTYTICNDHCQYGPEPGTPCDDGNSNTSNDVINSNCECVGTVIYNCPVISANIGDPCDDGNSNTSNDVINSNCECVGTVIYNCPVISANIGDPCDDGNSNTSNDVINSNCECVGTVVYNCPVIPANFGDPCNDGNPNTSNDVINSNCECAGTALPFETFTVCVQLNNKLDDAEEDLATGAVSTTSGDLEFVLDGPPLTGPFINQAVGLRFNGLNIPIGATITNAFIQFTADATAGVDPCNLNIRGVASDNAAAFATNINNISSRPVTNASVLWSPPNWTAGENGAAQQTNDISAVVQEIVNRTGYAASSSIAIIIDGVGKRTARSFDNINGGAAVLCVTYQIVCPDINNDGVCDVDLCPNGPEPGTPCNDGNPNTIYDVINGNCECAGTPAANYDVCSKISISSDDAEEHTDNGIVNLTSGDIELMFDGPHTGPFVAQVVGLRFLNLNIPNGAIINSAFIQFTSEATLNQDPSSIDFYGEASDNAVTFSNTTNNISNRTKTNASVKGWSPIAWTSTGIAGPDQQSLNIAAVIQEIVSRPGFTTTSAISIIMEGIGKRTAVSFDANALQGAEICINYSVLPQGGSPQGMTSNGSGPVEMQRGNIGVSQDSNYDTDFYRIYPVPAANNLNVDLSKHEGKPARISVYNQIGQLMEIIDMEEVTASPVEMNLENYTNGVYYMTIQIENGKAVSKKFIVSRLY